MATNAARVLIPADARPIIADIKNFAALSHSDDEIYAMLLECAMDPNDTAQKLLLQDTFHEVKKKRDKKKENAKESVDPRWKPGGQARGGRGQGGSYFRHVTSDAIGGKTVTSIKENGLNLSADVLPEKNNTHSSRIAEDTENKSKESLPSSVYPLANGISIIKKPRSSHGLLSQGSGDSNREISAAETSKRRTAKSISNDIKNRPVIGQFVSGPKRSFSRKNPPSVHSTFDPVLMPSHNSHNLGQVGTIKNIVGSQQPTLDATASMSSSCDVSGSEFLSVSEKGSSNATNSHVNVKIHTISHAYEASQLSDVSQALSSSTSAVSAGSRPSSNYSNRSQQISSHRAVPNKEWKPKSTSVNSAQPSETLGTSDVPAVLGTQSSHSEASEESASKIESKIDGLQLSEKHHVIIPNHLQVPDSERHGLSFGSFDADFKLSIGFADGSASDKSTSPVYEPSQDTEENVEQPSAGHHSLSSSVQESEYPIQAETGALTQENYLSTDAGMPEVSATQDFDQTKQEHTLATEGSQVSVEQTAPYSGFGLGPQMLGSQFATFESSESQAREATCVPNFLPFDPSTNYYTQLYRPTADADSRFSPFLVPGGATKYNGNVAGTLAQNGQNQESGNSLVLSTSGMTPLATQAAVIQSSIAVPQQPLPVFRHPAGIHISHYPPNYIPYSQYFSPYFVAPPALHHYLGSAAYPQQPPGTVYPPPGVAAGPVKYNLSQYKPGANTGNSTIVGMPTGYGTYNSAPTVNNGNSTGNEDLNSSQFKENNAYIPGQQSEGSAVWVPAPGRDISSLQASSIYGMPPQGQHLTFAPPQAGHGAFSSIFHPTATMAAAAHPLLQQSQTVAAGAVEVIGPTAGVYQQPQRAQMNWANNY